MQEPRLVHQGAQREAGHFVDSDGGQNAKGIPVIQSSRTTGKVSEPQVLISSNEDGIQSAGHASVIREEGEVAGSGVEMEQSESESDDAAIHEPFDPSQIRISTKHPTVDLVIKRMRHDEIVLQPDFQRSDNVWPIRTRSRLIESLLLRIPIPVFYMAADKDDIWKVVDGLQRLSALRDFVLDRELKLTGLEYLSQFESCYYDNLPRPMQRRIKETQLSCHVIEPGTPPEVMYNIFKRINTEGKPLAGQEVRHALNPGPTRDLLGKLASSEEFLRATDGTVSPKRMADRECVLRFLAFRSLGDRAYEGKLDDFLIRAMEDLNHKPNMLETCEADFRRAMLLASEIFGQNAFRKPMHLGSGQRRNPVNKALFETLSVALAEVSEEQGTVLKNRRQMVVDRLKDLSISDPAFLESVSVGTGQTRQVSKRFGCIRMLLHNVLQ